MCDINSAEEIQQHDLYDLRHSSSKAIGQLGEDLREVLLLSNVFLSIVRMRATLILSSMKSKPHCVVTYPNCSTNLHTFLHGGKPLGLYFRLVGGLTNTRLASISFTMKTRS